MKITRSVVGKIPVFHLAGRLDATSSPLLGEALLPLLEVADQHIIFDCAQLSYVSSAGLRVLISALRQLAGQGGGFALAALTPAVHALFVLAGVDVLFKLDPSVDAAAARILIS
jgi:anti-anti-sigma factor